MKSLKIKITAMPKDELKEFKDGKCKRAFKVQVFNNVTSKYTGNWSATPNCDLEEIVDTITDNEGYL